MMDWVLGIDSGGTKTIGLGVSRKAEVVRLRIGAGYDPTQGRDAEARLEQFARSLIGDSAPSAAMLGLPYHGEIANLSGRHDALAARLFGDRSGVRNDVAVAHLGAFGGGNGVLVLAGTGSMAWAEGPGGSHRAGGYGDVLGDEGSAYWIGQRALQVAARSIDGRMPDATGFARKLCIAIGVMPQTAPLIDWLYTRPAPRVAVAGLAKSVSALARDNDLVARDILDAAADELARAAEAAGQAAGLDRPLRWSHAGGVFTQAQVLRGVTKQLGTAPRAPLLPPVGGAVLGAARLAGWDISKSWIGQLAQATAAALSAETEPDASANVDQAPRQETVPK